MMIDPVASYEVTTALNVAGVPMVNVLGLIESANDAGTPLSVNDVAFEMVAVVALALTSTVIVPTLKTEPCPSRPL
jgi:hypothetical protein